MLQVRTYEARIYISEGDTVLTDATFLYRMKVPESRPESGIVHEGFQIRRAEGSEGGAAVTTLPYIRSHKTWGKEEQKQLLIVN